MARFDHDVWEGPQITITLPAKMLKMTPQEAADCTEDIRHKLYGMIYRRYEELFPGELPRYVIETARLEK